MDVEIARHIGHARPIDPVDAFATGQIAGVVGEAPELVQGGSPDLVAIGMDAHAARETVGGEAEISVRLHPDEEERALLIGRDSERDARFGQP